jgi:hypothetical protein
MDPDSGLVRKSAAVAEGGQSGVLSQSWVHGSAFGGVQHPGNCMSRSTWAGKWYKGAPGYHLH